MIQPVHTPISFKNSSVSRTPRKPSKEKEGNPVSRRGEAAKLVTATFVSGLALAGKLLFEIIDDGDFLVDTLSDIAEKATSKTEKDDLINKSKKEFKDKNILRSLGLFAALVAAVFTGFALLYTAFKTPQIVYDSKVNSFKKSKEMDVYTKSNEAEKELYTQLDEKAKSSSPEEKERLKEQYLKLKNAKNQTPDFVNVKIK